MLSLSKPLGRLGFLAAVTPVNLAIFIAATTAIAFRPTGGGHLAVLIVVGALQAVWFALHSRRFADAGRGRFWPLVTFLICFGSFALGYMIMAALWSSPEIQREAFKTAGALAGGGYAEHVETNALIIESGRAIAGLFGAAGAIILSSLVIIGLGFVSFASLVFSCIALVLPGQKAVLFAPRQN
ncbi:MAG: hypothetical protein ACRCWF_18245 [Beijerinckiaceae bacterium]